MSNSSVRKEYEIVFGTTLKEINKKVSKMLNEGWQLAGNLCIYPSKDETVLDGVIQTTYHQPMIK